MGDEFEDSLERPINLTIGTLYNNKDFNVLNKLQELCVRRAHQLPLDINKLSNHSNFQFKFKNCYESLYLNNNSSNTTQGVDKYNFVDIFFKCVKKSFGIAQIIGSSGSGKTSICLKIAHNIQGVTLYLDISGSFDPKRAPSGPNFIALRLYSLEELTLFLNDLEDKLCNDRRLCEFLDLKASSVEMLIIDSLWCVDNIDKFHRQEYLFNLSLILRRLSWKYNVGVLVCINHSYKLNKLVKQFDNINKDADIISDTSRIPENKRKDTYNKWNSNCYVKFVLNYKILNFNFNTVSKDKLDVPLVYRIMHINSGTLSKAFKFEINNDNILLEDV